MITLMKHWKVLAGFVNGPLHSTALSLGRCFHGWLWSVRQQCHSCIPKVTPLVTTRHEGSPHKALTQELPQSLHRVALSTQLFMLKCPLWASWWLAGPSPAVFYHFGPCGHPETHIHKASLSRVHWTTESHQVPLKSERLFLLCPRTVGGRSEGCSSGMGRAASLNGAIHF